MSVYKGLMDYERKSFSVGMSPKGVTDEEWKAIFGDPKENRKKAKKKCTKSTQPVVPCPVDIETGTSSNEA